ncbi:GYF_2 domain-containing protein [Pseudoscourfieldia marina]
MYAAYASAGTSSSMSMGDEHERWFFIDNMGAERGPFNFRVVRAHLRLGILNGDTMVWKEGQHDWMPAREVAVFHRCLNTTSTRSMELPGKHTAEALAKFTDEFHRMQTSNHITPSFAPAIATGVGPHRLRGGKAFVPTTVQAMNAATPQWQTTPAAATTPAAFRNAAAASWGTATANRPPATAARQWAADLGNDDSEWYYLAPGGLEVGPVSTNEMRRRLTTGEAGNAPWVWCATVQPEWAPAASVAALRPPPPPPVDMAMQPPDVAAAAAAASEARGLEAEADDLRLRLATALERLEEREARVRFFKDRLRSTQDDLAIKEREVSVLQEMIKTARDHNAPSPSSAKQRHLEYDTDANPAVAAPTVTKTSVPNPRTPPPSAANDNNSRELYRLRKELSAAFAQLEEKDNELVAAREALEGDLSWLVNDAAGA